MIRIVILRLSPKKVQVLVKKKDKNGVINMLFVFCFCFLWGFLWVFFLFSLTLIEKKINFFLQQTKLVIMYNIILKCINPLVLPTESFQI